jgi:tetratricopeptide (TPR) repeat protein
MKTSTKRTRVNTLWVVLSLAIVFPVVIDDPSSAQTTKRRPLKVLTPPFTANKGELLQELRDRKFQALDTQLSSYGNLQEAIRYYDQALEEGGDFALGYASRGVLYLKLGRYALQDLDSANRLRPQEPHVLASLA